ncbi:MAG TPA: M50 family metallopeptidase [Chloroflexota bacterium]|nr:M50 family metallopeptidase [Chloroflexota bacterium]
MEYLAIVPILGFLMIAHELGHFIVAKRSGVVVEEFAIGFPPRLFSIRRGGVDYTLNLIPLGAYVKMLGEEDPSAPGSFASQPKRIRALVLAAGSAMNFLVAVAVFTAAYASGWPDSDHMQVEVAEVSPGSPAQAAGIQQNDRIERLDDAPVVSLDQFREQSAQRLGQPIHLTINRSGDEVSVVVTPRTEWPEGQGPIGIRLRGRAQPVPHGPIESVGFGIRRSVSIVAYTVAAPVLAVRGQISPDAVRPIGLPGMTQVAAQATSAAFSSGWFFPVLLIMGAFSAGLAVANMLPLPALDGGRLVFVLLEAVRGRRVPPEREGLIHLVGMAVLVSIMVLISFHDLVTPAVPIDWGIR